MQPLTAELIDGRACRCGAIPPDARAWHVGHPCQSPQAVSAVPCHLLGNSRRCVASSALYQVPWSRRFVAGWCCASPHRFHPSLTPTTHPAPSNKQNAAFPMRAAHRCMVLDCSPKWARIRVMDVSLRLLLRYHRPDGALRRRAASQNRLCRASHTPESCCQPACHLPQAKYATTSCHTQSQASFLAHDLVCHRVFLCVRRPWLRTSLAHTRLHTLSLTHAVLLCGSVGRLLLRHVYGAWLPGLFRGTVVAGPLPSSRRCEWPHRGCCWITSSGRCSSC